MTPIEMLDSMESELGPLSATDAFETLVETHRAKVYGLCYRYSGNPADAEDLSQETFLRAYRGLEAFRGDASLSTWIYRIAVNVCLSWISAKKPPAQELPADLVDRGPSALERLHRRQTADTVRNAVATLPDRQRMTLVLRIYQELSHKEIGDIMGCPVGTAKANFFFALKNLKKRIGASSPELQEGRS